MKEKWIVEIEVNPEIHDSVWDHVDKKPAHKLLNEDHGITEIMEDGIHFHAYCTCNKILTWKLIRKQT